MEIIYVEDELLRVAFWAVLDLFVFAILIAISGALLAKDRILMYWWLMMAGIFAFVIVLSLSLLTGNLFLLLCGVAFLGVMLFSYFRQKKIISSEEAEKERLREIEKRVKQKEIVVQVMEKLTTGDYSRYMPQTENHEA